MYNINATIDERLDESLRERLWIKLILRLGGRPSNGLHRNLYERIWIKLVLRLRQRLNTHIVNPTNHQPRHQPHKTTTPPRPTT